MPRIGVPVRASSLPPGADDFTAEPLVYLFTPWLSFADYHLPRFAPWCGAILIGAGLWLFWQSHSDLGKSWSQSLELRKDHELISHGVYRFIRHPMYASIGLWSLGQSLVLENWLAGWCALAAFSLMYLIRTPRGANDVRVLWGTVPRLYETHRAPLPTKD